MKQGKFLFIECMQKNLSQGMQINNHIFVYSYCHARCLDGSLVEQKVVLCDVDSHMNSLKAAGAIGCIVPNHGNNVSEVGPLPIAALNTNDINLVKTYQNSRKYVFFPIKSLSFFFNVFHVYV